MLPNVFLLINTVLIYTCVCINSRTSNAKYSKEATTKDELTETKPSFFLFIKKARKKKFAKKGATQMKKRDEKKY